MASDMIKELILSEFMELQHSCHDSLKSCAEDSACLQKCMMKCQGVTSNFPATISGGQVSYYLQQFAEAVLDFTYHDEQILTNIDEFPEQNSKERIAVIFVYLDKIKSMCGKISPGSRLEELLGNEIAECILWRKGALLYGYCETVRKDEERLQRGMIEYRQNLQKGIHYLQSLFKIRDAVLDTAHIPGENDTLELLKMGIYSSTHLLALMYTGEMCYWFLTSSNESTDAERVTCNLGMEVLETYIQATEQMPELGGWSNDQAKKYLIEMKGR
ncbi:RAB7A-interacting MON1-CCZ1 complex subunit 1-like [Ruditapes philippinarum]|uniref:RAB7A-interacting MON1-CCZ1 complex subunit 1-like n=1 Tax=Ruditapes philippinarum TaxID=129788 RepID=UPI00295B2850|nr:RAB7A-interacting MON1-CCZ1 complex subunit 1-like [Ruditapes philippinarum]